MKFMTPKRLQALWVVSDCETEACELNSERTLCLPVPEQHPDYQAWPFSILALLPLLAFDSLLAF